MKTTYIPILKGAGGYTVGFKYACGSCGQLTNEDQGRFTETGEWKCNDLRCKEKRSNSF